jgi:hypothetical protein
MSANTGSIYIIPAWHHYVNCLTNEELLLPILKEVVRAKHTLKNLTTKDLPKYDSDIYWEVNSRSVYGKGGE